MFFVTMLLCHYYYVAHLTVLSLPSCAAMCSAVDPPARLGTSTSTPALPSPASAASAASAPMNAAAWIGRVVSDMGRLGSAPAAEISVKFAQRFLVPACHPPAAALPGGIF